MLVVLSPVSVALAWLVRIILKGYPPIPRDIIETTRKARLWKGAFARCLLTLKMLLIVSLGVPVARDEATLGCWDEERMEW